MKKKIIENLKTIIYALIIALLIRSFFFQPFFIPSSSMEPNLLIGDRLFASKYAYGYSRHSLPFSPNFTNKRLLRKEPNRGDVIIFKTPTDNRTDYIKRLIGLPGDIIQIINGDLYLNNKKIARRKINISRKILCGSRQLNVYAYEETLPNGKKYIAVYDMYASTQNTKQYYVPKDHYFFMGDNRDCSKDSRFLGSVSFLNLVGEANIIFFSRDGTKKLSKSFRMDRFFKKIK